MAEVDWGQVESQLKQKSGQWYDPTMLADVQRNSSYGAEGGANNVDDWVSRVSNKAQLRGSNETNSNYVANGAGGVTVGPTGKVNDPNGTGLPQSTAQAWNGAQTPAVDPALKAKQDELYNMLMARATQGTKVDRNDPNIRMQADTFSANTERARRNFLSDTAEQSGPYMNMGGVRRMASERAGIANATNESSLVGRELQSKRDEIAQALQSMQGMLGDSQKIDLQMQLAKMDNALGQRRLSLDEKTGGQSYDMNLRRLGLDDWGQQMYWDAMNSGRIS